MVWGGGTLLGHPRAFQGPERLGVGLLAVPLAQIALSFAGFGVVGV